MYYSISNKHEGKYMKTITVNVSEPIYRDFQFYGKEHDRTAAELIRQSMDEYWRNHMKSSGSLFHLRPVSAGKMLKPLSSRDDLFGEMLNEDRT